MAVRIARSSSRSGAGFVPAPKHPYLKLFYLCVRIRLVLPVAAAAALQDPDRDPDDYRRSGRLGSLDFDLKKRTRFDSIAPRQRRHPEPVVVGSVKAPLARADGK